MRPYRDPDSLEEHLEEIEPDPADIALLEHVFGEEDVLCDCGSTDPTHACPLD